MKRTILAFALAAALATAVGIAAAQNDRKSGDGDNDGPPRTEGHGPGMHSRGHGMGMRGGMGEGMFLGPERMLLVDDGGRLADELDLTGTQRDRLRDIGGDLERKEIRLRADLETAGVDLRDLMRSNSPSTSEVDAKIENLTGLRGEMMKAGARAVLDARKVLTSDQRKKLDDLRPGRLHGRNDRSQRSGSKEEKGER